MSKPLGVISFGMPSERPEYPRHRNLVACLRQGGAQVMTCHAPLAAGFQDRLRAATSSTHRARFLVRVARTYPALTRAFRKIPAPDVLLVGYPGIFHTHFARWLTRRQSPRPLILLDVFLSLHDAVVRDRQLLSPDGLPARTLHRIEGSAMSAADLCLIDTRAHAEFLATEFSLPRHKILPVPVGPSFQPLDNPVPLEAAKPGLSVVFVGTYIPLHGIEVILGAARQLLDHPEIRFTLIGGGQQRPAMEELARDLRLDNVEFRDWVPTASLPDLLRSHDVALGIFGTTEKAQRVIPIKVYDVCAAGLPLVSSNTPAARELLRDGDSALLVPPGDSAALAGALLRMQEESGLRRHLATKSHQVGWDPIETGRELVAELNARFLEVQCDSP